jgi:hypothetical protein
MEEIDLPFVNPYAFRQSQTAIGVRQYAEGPFTILHEIPTFGEPWYVPFEFPLYQWTAATWCRISGQSVEASARLCSLLFLYASVPVVVLLLRGIHCGRTQSYLMAAAFVLLPTYQFWGRSVLIESMALFFSLAFGCGCIAIFNQGKVALSNWASYLFTVVAGVLAALVKLTTFAVVFGLVIMLVSMFAFTKPLASQSLRRRFFAVGVINAISLAAGVYWTRFADGVKSQGLVTTFHTSESLKSWNFGTLALRLNVDYWKKIFESGVEECIPSWEAMQVVPDSLELAFHIVFMALLLLCVVWFVKKGCSHRFTGVIFLLSFVSGPLVFSNLYYVHQYYWYANNWLLLFSILLIIWDEDVWKESWAELMSVVQSGSRPDIKSIATVVALTISASFGWVVASAWKNHMYSHWQKWDKLRAEDKKTYSSMGLVESNLPDNGDNKNVLLFTGAFGTPELAYITRTRTLYLPPFDMQDEYVRATFAEAKLLQKRGYRFIGLAETTQEDFQIPIDLRDALIRSLDLELTKPVVDSDGFRFTLLAKRQNSKAILERHDEAHPSE